MFGGEMSPDIIRKTFGRYAVDKSEVLRIRYKGSQAAAHVSIANATYH